MQMLFFTFGLPLALGYSLFVGISGRLNPFLRPNQMQERPSWLLGVWIGVVTVSATGWLLYLSQENESRTTELFPLPGTIILAGLIAPAFVAYWLYRRRIRIALANPSKRSFEWVLQSDGIETTYSFDPELAKEHPLDIVLEETSAELDASLSNTQTAKVTSVILESTPIDTLKDQVTSVSISHERIPETDPDENPESFDLTMVHLSESDLLAIEENRQSGNHVESTDAQMYAEHSAELQTERSRRIKAESDLRSVRSQLQELENNAATQLPGDSSELIFIKEQLSASINDRRELEARHTLERKQRIELEESVARLRKKIVSAKHEIRRSTAARAKALSTANKSIAFARQAVQIRSRLEAELTQANNTMKERKSTVSSLIRALEKEKRRTEEDILVKAKQLIVREKQIQAKRSLEDMARSVENKLTSRLVKKVAKARPLATGSDSSSL